MSSGPDPGPPAPAAPWKSPQTILEQLREVDRSLRRCYIVQTLICLVFLYFFYNTVGAARELENLSRQVAHCACVKEEFPRAQALVAELARARSEYQRYLKDLGSALTALKKEPVEQVVISRSALPATEVTRTLEAYAGTIREALAIADKLGTSTLAEFNLDELAALARSVRPLTPEELVLILRFATKDEGSQLVQKGRPRALRHVVPFALVVPHSSCPSAVSTWEPPRAPAVEVPSSDIAERLAAIAAVKVELGGQKRLTAVDLETRRAELEKDRGTLAKEAQLAKTKLPLVEQEMELSLAFRLGPIALFFVQLLIAAYFRQRAALVAHLSRAFDDANVEQRAAKARIHLFLLPWVLNFPQVRIPDFEGARPRGARVTRAVVWGLAFLPVLTIALILFRPLYFGTRGQIAAPGAMSGVDVLFICLSLVFLVLTLLQVLDTRRLDRRVLEALEWAPPPAPVPPALVEARGRRELRFALWAILALVSNCSYAVTRYIRVDFAVVLPIIVLFVAYRFGKTRAWALGVTIVGLYAVPQFFDETLPWSELVYRRAWTGPLYIPHSSVADAVRLGLLGYCGGWALDRVRSMLREGRDWQHAWAGSVAATAGNRPRTLAVAVLAVSATAIVLANAVVRFSFAADGQPRTAVVPVTGLAVAACAAVGWWLGARAGWRAGAIALSASFLLHAWLVGPRPRVQLQFHELGHVLSFALVGYWAGRIGGFGRGVRPERTAPPVPADTRHPATGVLVLCVLVSSLLVTVQPIGAPVTFRVEILVLPFAAATAVLLGALLGARRGAWFVGVLVGGLALLAPWIQANYPGYRFTAGPISVTIVPVMWSAAAVVVLVAAAWLSGTFDLTGSRAARYLVAIGIFAAFELFSIARFGTFLTSYVTGQIAGVRVDLATGVARMLEPWLTVVLVEAGFKLLGMRFRAGSRSPETH